MLDICFGHDGDIGVGDTLPKGVKFSQLDSPAVYQSKKYLKLISLMRNR